MRPPISLAAGILGISVFFAAAADAQTIGFGPQNNPTDGAVTTFGLVVPAGDTGDQQLTVAYAGDLDSASEFIEVFVDGASVGILNGGAQCRGSQSDTLTVPDAIYTAAAADGSVDVAFDASPGVNAFCRGTLVDPFTAFNTGSQTAFVVQGTLTTGGGPAAAPGAPTTAQAQQETLAALRGTLILDNRPDHHERIARLRGDAPAGRALRFGGVTVASNAPFALDVDQNALSFAGGFDAGQFMFWAEATAVGINDESADEQFFGILHTGVDTRVGANTLVGLSLQLDRLTSTDIGTDDRFEGDGWMVGTLLTHRLGDDLFVDSRLAYGRVSTDVERAAGGRDTFDSDRLLFDLALIGSVTTGDFRIEPRGVFGWYSERSEAYTSASLGAVGETDVIVRQAELGTRILHNTEYLGGVATPFVDVAATFADISSDSLLSGSFADATEGWSGSISVGTTISWQSGATWSGEIGIGGLGSDTDTISGSLSVVIPF